MIDWLTFTAPLPHPDPICAGHVVSIAPDGSIEWQTAKRRSVEGSWSATLQIRTAPRTVDPCTHVEVHGNPVKWFQGHNLWGTDDLPSLLVATLDQVARLLGLEVDAATRAAWLEGHDIKLTRVDITQSFHLGSRAEVLAWLRAAEQTAHLSHRGRGQLVKGSGLYFGKHSRRWTLKLYSKGQEIEAKGHGQDAILSLPAARAWADRTLRAELVVRGMELKRMNLATMGQWKELGDEGPKSAHPHKLLKNALQGMTMTSVTTLPPKVLEALTNMQRSAYLAWTAGHDPRQFMSRPSFYRLRAKLLPHGVDIATLMPKDVSNVVPLRRALEAVPAQVPDWAQGTSLLFEPRRIA